MDCRRCVAPAPLFFVNAGRSVDKSFEFLSHQLMYAMITVKQCWHLFQHALQCIIFSSKTGKKNYVTKKRKDWEMILYLQGIDMLLASLLSPRITSDKLRIFWLNKLQPWMSERICSRQRLYCSVIALTAIRKGSEKNLSHAGDSRGC